MDNDIPKFSIIYSEVIQEITFDFEVEFTLFGEVLRITNDFLLLSEEVQETRFGENTNGIVRHLKLAKILLKYFVPLALMGYIKDKEWNKFKEKFDEVIAKRPNLKELNHSRFVRDKWVKEAWEWNDPKNDTLKFLCDLCFKKKQCSLPLN